MFSAAVNRLRSGACLILLAFVLFGAGCGGDDPTPPAKPITLAPPTKPVAADCGLTGEGSARNADRPPEPGRYRYRTTGTRALIGEKKRVSDLPQETQMIITEAFSDGAQSCFATQRRFESNLGDTGIFVINGRDTYLRSGRFQAGADITELTPDPPMLAMSGSELEWSGAFQGLTSGRYQVSIVGRKRMRVGGVSVQVVGVKTRVSYSGDIEGFERSTRWISVKDPLVVAEKVQQERAFGLDRMRLRYSSRLISLDPS